MRLFLSRARKTGKNPYIGNGPDNDRWEKTFPYHKVQRAFFDYLPMEENRMIPFVVLEMKAVFARIHQILWEYRRMTEYKERAEDSVRIFEKGGNSPVLLERMWEMLDQCIGFMPLIRNYIFREVLAECAQNDDINTFRRITERYGSRFGIVRYIPGIKREAKIRGMIMPAGKRDTFLTRKPAFLDLLEIEEDCGDRTNRIRSFLSLCLPGEARPSMKIISGEYRVGRAALLDGDESLLAYLSGREVRLEHGETTIRKGSDILDVNLPEAALLSGSCTAVGMALAACRPDEKIRDGVDAVIKRIPEKVLERLLTRHPDMVRIVKDRLAVTCGSRALYSAWLAEDSKMEARKKTILRTILEEVTGIHRYDASRDRKAVRIELMAVLNMHRMKDRTDSMERGIISFLKEMYHSCDEPGDRVLVCRLAFLYWAGYAGLLKVYDSPESEIVFMEDLAECLDSMEDSMEEFFESVSDPSWFFCVLIQTFHFYNDLKAGIEKIRDFMCLKEEQSLVIGSDYERCGVRIADYIAIDDLYRSGILRGIRYASGREYLEGLLPRLIEDIRVEHSIGYPDYHPESGRMDEDRAWRCVIPAYEQGFLSMEDLSSMLKPEVPIPKLLTAEIMNRMRSVSLEQEMRL